MKSSSYQYPVQKGDVIQVKISSLNHEGQGVGRYQGIVVFVPFTLPDDQVMVTVEEVKKSFVRGKVIELLISSERRTHSECASFEECGGCHLKHCDYGSQLRFKEDVVRNALTRIGKLEGVKVNPIIGMETPFSYRNKAEYPVKEVAGSLKSGFFAPKTHDLIAMDETCDIQHPLVEKARSIFMAVSNKDLKEEFTQAFFYRLVVRVGFFTGEVMVIIESEGPVPSIDLAAGCLISEMPQVKSVYQHIKNCGGKGGKFHLVMGEPFIRERIGSLDFDISPGSFFQVNPVQAEVLFSKATEYADCKGVAVDAYCGTGSISLFLAQQAKKVYGFEVYPEAVEDARHNADINGIRNAEFIQGDVRVTLRHLKGLRPETVVIDPPRKGCEKQVIKEIIDLRPQKIVYVSCNPATLARDLRILGDNGYTIKEVQPIDMFPHTYHVETVVLITRVEK